MMAKPLRYGYDETNAVTLTGNELGEGLSFEELFGKIKQYARENFVYHNTNKEFEIKSRGYKVRITMEGIRHTLGYVKTKDDIYALVALPLLLERAENHRKEKSRKERKNIDHIEICYASLKIGNREYIAEMAILVENERKKEGSLSNVRFFHHQKIAGPDGQRPTGPTRRP